QLYLGGNALCHQRSPNTWNRFIHQQLNDINEDLLKGDRWKLTEFISAHKETLQHDYSKLTTAQKNSYAGKLIKMHAEKQCVVRDNPKAVHHDTTMSFAAMDQEIRGENSDCLLICSFIQFVVDAIAEPSYKMNSVCCEYCYEYFTLLTHMLDDILRDKKLANHIKMNYNNYEHSIVEHYVITLVG
ncbi:hypothetical protein DFH29DRAFT_774283, partial [Suillus ampliporus]